LSLEQKVLTTCESDGNISKKRKHRVTEGSGTDGRLKRKQDASSLRKSCTLITRCVKERKKERKKEDWMVPHC